MVVPLTGEEIHGGPIDPGLLVQEPLHPQPDRHSHHLRPVCQKMKTKINNFVNFIQSKIFKFLRRLEDQQINHFKFDLFSPKLHVLLSKERLFNIWALEFEYNGFPISLYEALLLKKFLELPYIFEFYFIVLHHISPTYLIFSTSWLSCSLWMLTKCESLSWHFSFAALKETPPYSVTSE